jgi:3-oxoacyl-[acyl-carrier protein] reductase
MPDRPVVLITGTSRGIGRHLAEHYLGRGYAVTGCSRSPVTLDHSAYCHVSADVTREDAVVALLGGVQEQWGRLDALINNAGIASMNHCLLTPGATVERILRTNVLGPFLLMREAAKLMQRSVGGRIVNVVTVARPLKLEGEAVYAASKAAVESLTQIIARELAPFGITVNAVGPTPIETDLLRGVPQEKIDALLERQAIRRLGEFRDVANVTDFFLRPESDFITGQVLFLGGV